MAEHYHTMLINCFFPPK